MIRRIGLLSALATVSALSVGASASSAGAAVTLGELVNPSTSEGCPTTQVQIRVPPGSNSYTVPASGTITSWSTFVVPPTGETRGLKVFRKADPPADYQVIGQSDHVTLTTLGTQTFPANIQVKPGDLLGMFSPGDHCVSFPLGAQVGFADPEDTDLMTGEAASFLIDDDAQLSLQATLVPDNGFSLARTQRSKKKGTATLTFSLPNSGELTGSGNGAKVSSSRAVTSKSVGAGQAQLLINAKGKKKRKLNETGKVKLTLAITYTPTGGDSATQSVKVKLKKKLPRGSTATCIGC